MKQEIAKKIVLVQRFIWQLFKSILPQLNYCKQSFSPSITCGYAPLQIWTAQWPLCYTSSLNSLLWYIKATENNPGDNKFLILAKTIWNADHAGDFWFLMCLSLVSISELFVERRCITQLSVWGGFLVSNRHTLQLCVPNKMTSLFGAFLCVRPLDPLRSLPLFFFFFPHFVRLLRDKWCVCLVYFASALTSADPSFPFLHRTRHFLLC